MSSLTTSGGSLTIEGNTAATAIDMSSLTTSGGELVVAGNGSATVTDMSALTTVDGDLIIETTGSGTFNVSSATSPATSSSPPTATGRSTPRRRAARRPSPCSTVRRRWSWSCRPAGAFAIGDPVGFSVQQLAADPVESWGEGDVTTLAAYGFQFDITTLGLDATLDLESTSRRSTPARRRRCSTCCTRAPRARWRYRAMPPALRCRSSTSAPPAPRRRPAAASTSCGSTRTALRSSPPAASTRPCCASSRWSATSRATASSSCPSPPQTFCSRRRAQPSPRSQSDDGEKGDGPRCDLACEKRDTPHVRRVCRSNRTRRALQDCPLTP